MRDFGDEPRDLTAWLRAGIRRVDAVQWVRWRIELDEALAWRAAGVAVPLTAAQWRTAAVTPETVGGWRAAGIEPDEAVRFHEFRVDLEQARTMRAEGRLPWSARQAAQPTQSPAGARRSDEFRAMQKAGARPEIAITYNQAEWVDDEAMAWACQQITAGDARLWAVLGLRPAEVGELAAGQQAGDVVTAWWRSGIPYDEVAEWLGAGLTPDEAVAQRAAGVTVEQAAALRALRRGG